MVDVVDPGRGIIGHKPSKIGHDDAVVFFEKLGYVSVKVGDAGHNNKENKSIELQP